MVKRVELLLESRHISISMYERYSFLLVLVLVYFEFILHAICYWNLGLSEREREREKNTRESQMGECTNKTKNANQM